MALLVLNGLGLRLCWSRGRWLITRCGEELRRVRPAEVSEVICEGPIEVSAGARAAALARGTPVVFLTRDGQYRGRLQGPRAPSGSIPLAQVRWLADGPRQLALARALVQGKLGNSRTLLMTHQRRRRSERIASAAAALRSLVERAGAAPSLDSVRGFEGEGARRYFEVWNELVLHPTLGWTGRSRRPPRDPINSCLSYLYTLLAARVEDALYLVGLLPTLGSLHEPGPGRLPLVYDLVEEFRAPLVDRVVLRLVNRNQIAPEDFEDPSWRRPTLPAPVRGALPEALRPSGAVYLGRDARALVVRELAAALRSDIIDREDGSRPRAGWVIERQARRLSALFRGEAEAYLPFAWGGR